MPVELSLELMAIVGPSFLDADRELFHGAIGRVLPTLLRAFVAELWRHDTRRVIAGSISEPADFITVLCDDGEGLDVDLE